MNRVKTIINGNKYLILATAMLIPFGCKTRTSDSSLMGAVSTVTETGLINKTIKLKGKGLNENYVEITVDKVGLIRFSVSLSSNSQTGFTKPVSLAAFSEADQTTPLASGDIKVDPTNPTDANGEMFVNAPKTGKYYVLVRHNQQLEDATNDYASVRSRIMLATPAASYVINTIPGNFDSTEVYDGTSIKLGLTAAKVLSNISVSNTIYAASAGVVSDGESSCPTCAGKFVITQGTKTYVMPLDVSDSGDSSEAAFDFDVGTYSLQLVIDNLPAGSLVDVGVDLDPITNNQGGPFSTVGTLGMLPLAFDQDTSRRASYHGKQFGFAISSDRASEAQLGTSFEIKRILNLAKKQKMPTTIGLNVYRSSDKANVVGKIDIDGSNGYFNGDVIGDFAVGKYRAVFSKDDIDDADILFISGNLAAVELSIKDGGPAASTFSDINPLTITPPNNYLEDMAVQPGTVHVPQTKPVDFASASVLAGMEKIRNAHHVRIPKGVPRGNRNRVDANTISACLGNEAAHWSDIIIHYYCQYGQARSCYTNTIRGKAQAIGGDATLDQAAKLAKLKTIRLETFTECAATVGTNPDWKWIMDPAEGGQAEVFQYIMNSQTFGFDLEQQQAVINKFYRIDNPADKGECIQKRPRRAIDPGDGTHCLATKIFSPAMKAAGR